MIIIMRVMDLLHINYNHLIINEEFHLPVV